MIQITQRAATQILKMMQDQGLTGSALRLGVKPSGCSGLEYVMDFEQASSATDQVHEFHELGGLKVLMDDNSAAYLQDIQLDWGDGLLGSGFKFSNPNASKTCGCGKSFSV